MQMQILICQDSTLLQDFILSVKFSGQVWFHDWEDAFILLWSVRISCQGLAYYSSIYLEQWFICIEVSVPRRQLEYFLEG